MLSSLNKHFIKNYKNFLISQYFITNKELFFNNTINIKIVYSKKNFFLASFLLLSFCILKYKYNVKKQNINISLNIFNFFFIFNVFFYSFLNSNSFLIHKKSKGLTFLTFLISNFFSVPLAFFFLKNFRWLDQKNTKLVIKYFLKKNKYKYLQFFFNFLQIPIFLKINV